MATISTYNPPLPAQSGNLAHARTTGCNALVFDDDQIWFDPDPNDLFKGNGIVFGVSGFNNIFFELPAPKTFAAYSLWLGEDFQSGDRAARRFQLYGGLTPVRKDFALIDEAVISVPYFETYGGDNIRVDGTFTSQSLRYFQLRLHATTWGFKRFGTRVHGFDLR